jgi:hypothetical protein
MNTIKLRIITCTIAISLFTILPYISFASETPIELKEDFKIGFWYIASKETYEKLHQYREHGIDIARIYEYNICYCASIFRKKINFSGNTFLSRVYV